MAMDAERKPGTPSTRYSPEAKAEILRDLEVSGLGLVAFCREHGLNTKSVCSWRKAYAEHGDAGLLPRDNRRNLGGRSGRVVPAAADGRIAVVELLDDCERKAFAHRDFGRIAAFAHWRSTRADTATADNFFFKIGDFSRSAEGTCRLSTSG